MRSGVVFSKDAGAVVSREDEDGIDREEGHIGGHDGGREGVMKGKRKEERKKKEELTEESRRKC